MSDELPSAIVDAVAGLPEFRMGVHRVQVELASGRTFANVMIAGNRVVKILGRDEIPFDASEVVGVRDMSGAFLPSALQIRIRRVGDRRTLPFFHRRSEYEIVITNEAHQIFSGTTTVPSAILVRKGKVHPTDSYDWIKAADQAYSSHGEGWITDPFGIR